MPEGCAQTCPRAHSFRGHVLDVFPFLNDLVTVELPGGALKRVLEHGCSLEAGMVQVSGWRVRATTWRARWGRVCSTSRLTASRWTMRGRTGWRRAASWPKAATGMRLPRRAHRRPRRGAEGCLRRLHLGDEDRQRACGGTAGGGMMMEGDVNARWTRRRVIAVAMLTLGVACVAVQAQTRDEVRKISKGWRPVNRRPSAPSPTRCGSERPAHPVQTAGIACGRSGGLHRRAAGAGRRAHDDGADDGRRPARFPHRRRNGRRGCALQRDLHEASRRQADARQRGRRGTRARSARHGAAAMAGGPRGSRRCGAGTRDAVGCALPRRVLRGAGPALPDDGRVTGRRSGRCRPAQSARYFSSFSTSARKLDRPAATQQSVNATACITTPQ